MILKKLQFSLFAITIFSLLSSFSSLVFSYPRSFTQAKKVARKIYTARRVTFYCGCKYTKHMKVNFSSCGYVPRKNIKRANRVEWEHIVPAWAFGHMFACWREKICKRKNGKRYGGRKCCEKINPKFKQMEADLYNLVPAIGEVNGDRNNFSFSDLGVKPYQYGKCNFAVDFKSRKVQPAPYARGFIARTYLYFKQKYDFQISKKQLYLFNAWNQKYPPSKWENTRNRIIANIYNSNINK